MTLLKNSLTHSKTHSLTHSLTIKFTFSQRYADKPINQQTTRCLELLWAAKNCGYNYCTFLKGVTNLDSLGLVCSSVACWKQKQLATLWVVTQDCYLLDLSCPECTGLLVSCTFTLDEEMPRYVWHPLDGKHMLQIIQQGFPIGRILFRYIINHLLTDPVQPGLFYKHLCD